MMAWPARKDLNIILLEIIAEVIWCESESEILFVGFFLFAVSNCLTHNCQTMLVNYCFDAEQTLFLTLARFVETFCWECFLKWKKYHLK